LERKEARRVKLWLSELDVPEWQELAGDRLSGVEEDVEEHQDMNIACVVGTGQKMDRAQDATLTNRGTRQSERATRVMACTTRRPKYI
jgi:hypothetical protein